MTAQSMAEARIPFNVVDFSLGLGRDRQDRKLTQHSSRSAQRRCTIMHINADQMVRAYWHLGPRFFSDRYIIGYWAWELPRLPDVWHPVLGMVDEIWAPSEFICSAITPFTKKPVVHMPLCVELPPFTRMPRSAFGLRDTDFVFAFAFDCHSWISRKNPAGIVRAFRSAFPASEPVKLVLKAMNGSESDPQWLALVDLIGADPRITLVNEIWPRERLLALLAASDAYVSLHRSEGFGRTPAEAMLLGKPVIVTAYSGTQDFCDDQNSLQVGFDLVELGDGEYPLGERQVWADPDQQEAANHMRQLFESPGLAANLGESGRRTISEHFSGQAIGNRYHTRLDMIGMLNEQELK
jgi:glycosyltransferase involved in cell wall biosynthesis